MDVCHAPYNFVPFSNRVLERYATPEDIPAVTAVDGKLKSGMITYTLTADTSVFVSDGQGDPHFTRNADEQYIIPGSTLKGMVRSNMQILGFGLMDPERDMDDVRILYRSMAAGKDSLAAQAKAYYTGKLDVRTEAVVKEWNGELQTRHYSIPQKIQCGYLYRGAGETYYIRKTMDALQIPRSQATENGQDLRSEAARYIPVSYKQESGQTKIYPPEEAGANGKLPGMLLCTGNPIGKKLNCHYLFPEPENEGSIVIAPKDILAYKVDLEKRSNSLKAYYDVDFWALPAEGERKPVFFLQDGDRTYFGMTRFLRIGYAHTLADGLPQRHRDAYQENKNPVFLDYANAILGFSEKTRSLRSRVRFGNAVAQTEPPEELCSTILGGPKPSFFAAYSKGGKDYNQDDFELSGYKQYWLKEMELSVPEAGRESVSARLRLLPKGTSFTAMIRYTNLNEDELGLLLWCLRLENGCFQQIGMGKNCGCGRMKPRIDRLDEADERVRYRSFVPVRSEDKDPSERVSGYIASYDSYVRGKFNNISAFRKNPVREIPEIKDFFYMRSTIRDAAEVRQMALADYRNLAEPLKTVRQIREEAERRASPRPAVAPSSPWAALAQFQTD